MTTFNAPFGFSVDNQNTGGIVRTKEYYNIIPSGYASNILSGQPVALTSSGLIVPVTSSGSDIFGIMAGVEWVDATGIPHVFPAWLAGTTTQTGSDIKVYLYTDPDLIFEVQADGSIPASALGNQTNVSNGTAGSTNTGYSFSTVSATLSGAGVQGQFRIVGFSLRPDNAPGDAYTIVQVQIAQNQFYANKVAI